MIGKRLHAGALRHPIKIQRNIQTQDQTDGSILSNWVDVYPLIYASIDPLSGREFLVSSTTESAISVRITIRYKKDIEAKMRIVKGETIYNIEAVLPDIESGREYLTLPCSTGILNEEQWQG